MLKAEVNHILDVIEPALRAMLRQGANDAEALTQLRERLIWNRDHAREQWRGSEGTLLGAFWEGTSQSAVDMLALIDRLTSPPLEATK